MKEVIPDPAMLWLIGPSGAGKSTWAARRYPANQIVSSDTLRAVVGTGSTDLDASEDAFDLLVHIATRRIGRKLTTVVDTLGYDSVVRDRLAEAATAAGLPMVAVVFETPDEVCRARNRQRDVPLPARALAGQFRRRGAARLEAEQSGWRVVEASEETAIEPVTLKGAAAAAEHQSAEPKDLQFHLVLSSFEWANQLGPDLINIARAAEGAGFDGIAVMDHLMQIPQVGRPWELMPEPYTLLSYLAAATETLRLGTLVTNVTLRHPALLGKMIATLDVLSGGRAECAVGAGWFEHEQRALGIPFADARERLDAVEDLVRFLPVLWGPGSKAFVGRRLEVTEATCYPRPIQNPLPIIIGGGGEHRTLRLVAEHGSGCNLTSDPGVLSHKLDVLSNHCSSVGRSMEDVLITVLDITVVASDRAALQRAIERRRGTRTAGDYQEHRLAGTVEDQIGRYRQLADLGVKRVYVGLDDFDGSRTIETFAPVVAAFESV